MKPRFLLILFSILLFSCGPSAIQYNDRLIGPQQEIAAHLDTLFSAGASYDLIRDQRLKLLEKSEEALIQIRTMKDFKGNTEYQQAAVKYYSFIANYFSSTLEIDSLLYNFSDKERIPYLDENLFLQTQKNFQHFEELENELKREQEKFAQSFGLKL